MAEPVRSGPIRSGGILWSLESDETLFKTDKRGNYVQVGGKGEYRGTKMLLSMGTMYRTR